jgi:hypothetical protein
MANFANDFQAMFSRWCATCNTPHTVDDPCPGRLVPVDSERHGWRANVDTLQGIDAYGVLLARCTNGYRARILTYPNILWLVPGGRETLKFAGRTVDEAEGQAVDYIRGHCRERGFELRDELPAVEFYGVDPEGAVGRETDDEPAARKIRFLPVRFGVGGATEAGGTGNLSETGMFIITNSPVESGKRVSVALRVDSDQVVRMTGAVVWMSKDHHVGRSPGMGVRLDAPPNDYVDYVKQL